MTDAEQQALKFEVENLKSRLDALAGNDPASLHPHGSRSANAPDKQNDTQQRNLNDIFARLGKVEQKADTNEQFVAGLRGEGLCRITKNVVTVDAESVEAAVGGKNTPATIAIRGFHQEDDGSLTLGTAFVTAFLPD